MRRPRAPADAAGGHSAAAETPKVRAAAGRPPGEGLFGPGRLGSGPERRLRGGSASGRCDRPGAGQRAGGLQVKEQASAGKARRGEATTAPRLEPRQDPTRRRLGDPRGGADPPAGEGQWAVLVPHWLLALRAARAVARGRCFVLAASVKRRESGGRGARAAPGGKARRPTSPKVLAGPRAGSAGDG